MITSVPSHTDRSLVQKEASPRSSHTVSIPSTVTYYNTRTNEKEKPFLHRQAFHTFYSNKIQVSRSNTYRYASALSARTLSASAFTTFSSLKSTHPSSVRICAT